MDRRQSRSNGRVAHLSMQGQLSADSFVDGTTLRVCVPLTNLVCGPDGARDKQLQYGQRFTVLETQGEWSFGFDPVDGYTGYIWAAALAAGDNATHRITVLSSHQYAQPDMKSWDLMRLPYGAELTLTPVDDGFFALQDPWLTVAHYIPAQHVTPLDRREADPAAVAHAFLGTPYLWGGNTAFGIDCSGLVQTALRACGIACPRDSDEQSNQLGADVFGVLKRGDIVFWKGHVGMMLDAETLIHANAHHMAVAIEPFAQARDRIAQKEFGDVTRIARL